MKATNAREISDSQLNALVRAKAVSEVDVLPGDEGGWVIRVNGEFYLRSQREAPRRFASLDTALRYLRDRGVIAATVELANWRDKPPK